MLQPYTIGKYYSVPTVYGQLYATLAHWPVIGPKHEDAEIINFPDLHYHVDWRFVPQRLLARVGWDFTMRRSSCSFDLPGQRSLGMPLHEGHMNVEGLPPPIQRRLKCKRDFPPYPAASFIAPLEKKFAGCRLKKNHACPHRGVPLGSLPRDEHGVAQCPAHGLRWNLNTGLMVREKAK